jgi:hypothetical protein
MGNSADVQFSLASDLEEEYEYDEDDREHEAGN